MTLARRYVAWLDQHARAIVVVYALLLAGAIYLAAFRLPLRADFSYLLPQDAASVRDLRRLEARVRSTETVLALVQAPNAEARAAAAADLAGAARALPRDLVEEVIDDDRDLRELVAAHLPLYVPEDEIGRAHV